MGIQFKQIDNLENTFDSLSGNLQGQITDATGSLFDLSSGEFRFDGSKYFKGNVDFSGAQGIFVDPNNIYTPNSVFASSINIGYPLSTPRNSTPSPVGALQVSGGQINLEDQVNVKNNSNLIVENGTISGGTGNISYVSGDLVEFDSGHFDNVNASSAEFSQIVMSGNLTGLLKLHDIPDYTVTGDIPAPASGTVFRSGHHLMIV
jgi:hypothetical protein